MTTTNLKTTDVRSRISPELKMNAGIILQNCGLDLSTGIRLFLQNVVEYQGIPFPIKAPNLETQEAMLSARAMGKGRFSSLEGLLNDLENNSPTQAGKTAAANGLRQVLSQGLGATKPLRAVQHERPGYSHAASRHREPVAV